LSSPFGIPDGLRGRSVVQCFRQFSEEICRWQSAFGGLTRFVPCSLGFFKKPKFFDAFLSVGGLLPEDSILKERLVFFQLIE
jgi:hypothetical protein